ncbi:MAG: DNA-binding transcriptional repressor [Myxococcaceae bacterium]|nr:DNA-binding transcriptional repressor [Myxococcaceae bacterium]
MVLRAKPEKVEERERTRHALLRATLLLAAKHGFAGLGLREVARGAEIAPTSFYRHFTDMEELGLALVDELVAPFLQDWLVRTQAGLEHSDRPAYTLVEQAFATLRRDRDLMRFVLAERVGAITSCRLSLRSSLAKWAESLGASSRIVAQPVAEIVLFLLLENLSEALESESREQASMRRLEQQLSYVLAAPTRTAP